MAAAARLGKFGKPIRMTSVGHESGNTYMSRSQMIQLHLGKSRAAYQVLCLGAHADDIEIGCGGTILRLLAGHSNLEFHWVVFSSTPQRRKEARRSADLFLQGARKKAVVVKNFRNSFFPFVGGQIKEYFEKIKRSVAPDLIFTHYRKDLHQDHRVICEMTWNTFRDHLVLEYEIPKYDGDLGSPNCFVDLDDSHCRSKIRHLMTAFRSQKEKHWFTEDTFRGLLRLRGIECSARGKYAEAFYCRKVRL
jgi:LmbE family N-acetylglucosaminyl deacetylase